MRPNNVFLEIFLVKVIRVLIKLQKGDLMKLLVIKIPFLPENFFASTSNYIRLIIEPIFCKLVCNLFVLIFAKALGKRGEQSILSPTNVKHGDPES